MEKENVVYLNGVLLKHKEQNLIVLRKTDGNIACFLSYVEFFKNQEGHESRRRTVKESVLGYQKEGEERISVDNR
jgi:hypothetical protein